MANVYFDRAVSDDERRQLLYQGDIFVLSPSNPSLALCQLADDLLREAFAPHDPEFAQQYFSVDEYASILAKFKPKFIHHPESKQLIPQILQEAGCDLSKSYFDVPKPRTATANGYLTTGIAYAFHPHRDTWYAAAPCQINWWMPVRPVATNNCMAFYPRYFSNAVKNSSNTYDYYVWNMERKNAAKHVGKDTRVQPKPEQDLKLEPDLRLVPPVGGIIMFSGAQLHASVENTSERTRFSIDFRTVNEQDVRAMRGAANVDSDCTGTALRDFVRCTDLERLPAELIRPYDSEELEADAVLLYEPD